ncbi:hypothetical protein CS0771_35090 [Catellatospora sp. IY07-71]|uniref:hypothetical protein n=1 Tax=Catellatospora sp. IY07-71 TaxID=2728827 RepID=UPI001BB372D6|nr:hypothetical protein [Catellatospora sp. IY07-71]BCJ73965.1 hypothetical protein CS0771_35090 [Catellatospora sp. IY07-71]
MHVPNYPYGVVTACGERAASSTGDAAKSKSHVRAWVINGGLVAQEVHVLLKQHAKDVVAKAASMMKGCRTYSDAGEAYRRLDRHAIVLPGTVAGAAGCFSNSGLVTCFAYLGRGRTVTQLATNGDDQEAAEWLMTRLIAAAEQRLVRIPA